MDYLRFEEQGEQLELCFNRAQVREAYAEHLHQYPWDYYITQTFRNNVRDGLRASQSFWNILETKFHATRAFVAVEPNRLSGIHLHALTRHVFDRINEHALWKYLFKAEGRSKVEVPRWNSTALVTWYCSKYITKGDCDFHYFGDKSSWLLDNAMQI